MAHPECKECGLPIGLLSGKPPSSDDVALCQDCFFTGSSKRFEQTSRLTDTEEEDDFLLTLLLFFPKCIWLYSVIIIAFSTSPFMKRDYEQWNSQDWGTATFIFAVEIAAFSILLWIIGVLPDSSDLDPYWH